MQITTDEPAFHVVGELEVGFSPDVEGKIDGLLLQASAETKPAKVRAGQARSESRAWSFGGNVD